MQLHYFLSSPPGRSQISPLLRLPIELRRQIYGYVLPSTSSLDVHVQRRAGSPERSEFNLTYIRQTIGNGVWRMQKTYPKTEREIGNETVWHRGCISILSTNHQIHDECVDMLYGDNAFVIDVAFDSVKFRYRWLVASSNLTPCRSYSFLDHFSQRNLMRIKNYVINVEHVDDYTGMIKYNCGGRGLTAGILEQVQTLNDLLSLVPCLHRLQIHLIDGAISRVRFPSGRVHRVQDDQNYSQSQRVLDPFHRLYGVRRAKVTGVSAEYAETLEKSMMNSRGL
ncbi:hypothetical protein P154DRAFT_42861 [Amniculicola lignicola CBS 123094]|uniref:DUF7730 domain-containing protein n=1 Tax=Amniculicola lignicola CBS 123094 TaxID=1392246 RepID=A0A6A5X1T4_9PLEO|nr:hypothetical protein P154DRAFT_42861 [Amniculicola lignicola CBS 123094]